MKKTPTILEQVLADADDVEKVRLSLRKEKPFGIKWYQDLPNPNPQICACCGQNLPERSSNGLQVWLQAGI